LQAFQDEEKKAPRNQRLTLVSKSTAATDPLFTDAQTRNQRLAALSKPTAAEQVFDGSMRIKTMRRRTQPSSSGTETPLLHSSVVTPFVRTDVASLAASTTKQLLLLLEGNIVDFRDITFICRENLPPSVLYADEIYNEQGIVSNLILESVNGVTINPGISKAELEEIFGQVTGIEVNLGLYDSETSETKSVIMPRISFFTTKHMSIRSLSQKDVQSLLLLNEKMYKKLQIETEARATESASFVAVQNLQPIFQGLFDNYAKMAAQKNDPQNFPDIMDNNNAEQVANVIEGIQAAQQANAEGTHPTADERRLFKLEVIQQLPYYHHFVQQQLAQQGGPAQPQNPQQNPQQAAAIAGQYFSSDESSHAATDQRLRIFHEKQRLERLAAQNSSRRLTLSGVAQKANYESDSDSSDVDAAASGLGPGRVFSSSDESSDEDIPPPIPFAQIALAASAAKAEEAVEDGSIFVRLTFVKGECYIDNPVLWRARTTVGDIKRFIGEHCSPPTGYPKVVLSNKKEILKDTQLVSSLVKSVNSSENPLDITVGYVRQLGGKRTKKHKHNHRRNKTKSALSKKKIKRYSVKAKRDNRRKSHKRA
jgi:hypothetical protein